MESYLLSDCPQRPRGSRGDGEVGDGRARLGCLDEYFAGLEALSAHTFRTMIQVAAVADVTIPKIADAIRYDANWDLDVYVVDVSELRLERQTPPEDYS